MILVELDLFLNAARATIREAHDRKIGAELRGDRQAVSYAMGAIESLEAIARSCLTYKAEVAAGRIFDPGFAAMLEGASTATMILRMFLTLRDLAWLGRRAAVMVAAEAEYRAQRAGLDEKIAAAKARASVTVLEEA